MVSKVFLNVCSLVFFQTASRCFAAAETMVKELYVLYESQGLEWIR